MKAVKILQDRGWCVGLGWHAEGVSILYRRDGDIFTVTLQGEEFDDAEKLAEAIEELLWAIN